MSNARPVAGETVPLAAEDAAVGDLLRTANEEYQTGLNTPAKLAEWLSAARDRRTKRRTAFGIALPAVAALAVAAAAVLFIRRGADEPALAPVLVASGSAAASGEPVPQRIALGDAPATLALGTTALPDGSRVAVAAGSVARVRAATRATEVAVERGQVRFDITPQRAERRFEVHAGAFKFSVLGTAFAVSAVPERVVLEVQSGRVAVSKDDRLLVTLGAGERWASDEREPSAADGRADVLAPSKPAARAADGADRARAAAPEPKPLAASAVDCLALARQKRTREAEQCFAAQASESGIGAEMALFELSRLRSDVLSDANGALRALDEHRARFPRGSLRAEVDVSRVELLARVGRRKEALDESARLLATGTGRERSVELHLLRAGILRTGFKDLQGAEREYAAAESAGGARSGDAAYHRGVCLEELGDRSGARAAYLRYVAVPGRPREAEARRRLAELEP